MYICHNYMRLLPACAAVILGPLATADIVIEKHPRNGAGPEVSTHAGAAPIEIEVDDTIRRVNIYSTAPAVEDIGPVTITGGGSLQIYVIVGDGDHPTVVPNAAARDLAGMDIERGNIDFLANISGDVRGLVTVPRVARMDVGGVVRSPIEQRWDADLWMEVGGVGPAGAIRALAGRVHRLGVHGDCLGEIVSQEGINNIQIVGDLQADVTALGGQIAWLEVGGTIGEPDAWVNVRSTSHVLVRGAAIYADIEAGVGGNDGRIRELATTNGGFTGRVRGTRLDHFSGQNEPLRIRGDFDGDLIITHSVRRDLTIEGDVMPGSLIQLRGITRLEETSSDEHWGALRVGGDVRGTIAIDQLQRGGFVDVQGDVPGTIIVGEWFDQRNFQPRVSVGGTVPGSLLFRDDVAFPVTIGGDAPGVINVEGALTVPMYVNSAGSAMGVTPGDWSVNGVGLTSTPWYPEGSGGELGGALIARAPFAVHRSRSYPVHGSIIDGSPCLPAPARCGVVLRFYGPVSTESGGGAGADVVVQRRQIGTTAWIDISDQYVADFLYGAADEALVFPVGVGRFEQGFAYRVRPRAELRSEGAARGVGVEDAVWLDFQIGATAPGCGLADMTTSGSLNGVPDGVVDLSDFSFYLNTWSVGDARADLTATGTCEPGTGGDGVDLSDFSCYLNLWAAGCP